MKSNYVYKIYDNKTGLYKKAGSDLSKRGFTKEGKIWNHKTIKLAITNILEANKNITEQEFYKMYEIHTFEFFLFQVSPFSSNFKTLK